MPIFQRDLPLSLYVHLPWCVRKCPYCDFNSHEKQGDIPEKAYVAALMSELDYHSPTLNDRPLISIFFGGGTPSLFSGEAIHQILNGIAKRFSLCPNIEITLEANPGTLDGQRFADFYRAGVNRLSLGIQSLQDDKLKILGRIHHREQAMRAISSAKEAGFTRLNLDIMYGLPQQSLEDALFDLETALAFQPVHFSWYQLTIEPNTLFYHRKPSLPPDESIDIIQREGLARLKAQGLHQYEVSAYAQTGHECIHNRNYWEFGDYLGIGAGAHSKLTHKEKGSVTRLMQVKHPMAYLDTTKRILKEQIVSEKDLIFEFMLNALRLSAGFDLALFSERTGLALDCIHPLLAKAKQNGLLKVEANLIYPTELGKKFLNNLIMLFL